MVETYKPSQIAPVDDWEEQHFANLSPENTLTQGELEFGPTPPHVTGTPPWKPLTEVPFYQKRRDLSQS